MGFRNEEEARAHRMRALETELEERDRKIAELEAKLEGREAPDEVEDSEGDDSEAESTARTAERIPVGPDVPTGDRWMVPVHRPHQWTSGVALLAVLAGGAWFYHIAEGMRLLYLIMLISPFALLSLLFFQRRYLILDKEAGTITEENRLIIRWIGDVWPYRGESSRVKRRYYRPSKDHA